MTGRILIFTLVFPPDPAAVGQQIADAARELARRGSSVVVFTSARGYDDPSLRFPSRERSAGLDIRRLRGTSFGKSSMLLRMISALSFIAQAFIIALRGKGIGGILFSTTPPMIGVAVTLAARLRGIPTAYWVMDLNPDQVIALGRLRESSMIARFLEAANRFTLRRAAAVLVLDRFMAERIDHKHQLAVAVDVIPPWAHETDIGQTAEGETNPFVLRHGLVGQFIVMYSGNHSLCNPLSTLLRAAERLREDPRIRFVFIGGGIGKREIHESCRVNSLENVLSLPYQSLADLKYSLRAADVHVVSLGDAMVGIIHPCKVYGAMAVERPVLYLGPPASYLSDLLTKYDFGWQVAHGDVDSVVALLERLSESGNDELSAKGKRARMAIETELAQAALCGRLCDRLQQAFATPKTGQISFIAFAGN